MNEQASSGRLLGIAVRSRRNGPMKLLDFAEVREQAGIDGDLAVSAERGVTLLAQEQWQQVVDELGTPLPWHTRRANLLVQGLVMGDLVGRRLSIGEVELDVQGETKPCGLMDEIQPGLREALVPELRGGVHARVLQSGTISVGDAIRVSAGD